MKAASALLLAFCFSTSANAAKIVSVGDGDTVRVSDGSGLITVRLACIDAPETSQRYYADDFEKLRNDAMLKVAEITKRESAVSR